MKRGRIGSRGLGRKAQRLAISTVFSIASGRSANSAAISLRRLEIMLGRQPAAVLGGDDLALGDADQRIMGGEVVGRGEIGLVGGDQRQVELIGEIDQAGFGRALVARVPWRCSST